jgi:hypothetical protein
MPLTADRNTQTWLGDIREGAVGASTRIFAGALIMRNAAGFLIRGAVATGATGVGIAEAPADNSAGANGAINVRYRTGIVARFRNATAGDLIVQADVGLVAWILDDDQVAKTNGTNTRSRAGIIEAVDAQGVWVRLDEAVTRGAP